MLGFWLFVTFLATLAGSKASCPSQYFPHEQDCGKFYQCVHGNPVEMTCPAGTHFNPEANVCDRPSNAKCEKQCETLGDANGHWEPPSCISDGISLGTSCSLVCNSNFELRGSASVQCTEEGWNSTNGNFVPSCVPSECVGEIMEDQINKTLSVNAGLLFVLDESGSITESDFIKTKVFVKNLISKFPLSANRSAGVITFSTDPVIRISMSTASTSDFMAGVDSMQYRGGRTDLLGALQVARNEILNNQHQLSLIFIITDGASQTDATPAANDIKSNNNPIFAIGVAQTQLVYLESLSSGGTNGIKHFFHIRSYEILESIGKYINRPVGPGNLNNTQCTGLRS